MGFLDRAIKRGISNAVSGAVEQGVRKAVEPKIEQATANAVNSAAKSINDSVSSGTQNYNPENTQVQQSQVNTAEVNRAMDTLGGLFGGLSSGARNFANEAAKNMKICPECGEAAPADNMFCPSCGAKLPEMTVAQGAVCSVCGRQNDVGTKFCAGCGAKLPAAIAEEEAQKKADEAVLAKWDELLYNYPKWSFGGHNYEIENNGAGYDGNPMYLFTVHGTNSQALDSYVQLLKQNGFIRPEGYTSDESLYKMIDGKCFAFGQSEAFSTDPGVMCVAFYIGDYDKRKKEQPKRSFLGGLFG